jgi:hypothetical protein
MIDQFKMLGIWMHIYINVHIYICIYKYISICLYIFIWIWGLSIVYDLNMMHKGIIPFEIVSMCMYKSTNIDICVHGMNIV